MVAKVVGGSQMRTTCPAELSGDAGKQEYVFGLAALQKLSLPADPATAPTMAPTGIDEEEELARGSGGGNGGGPF